jgi:hypothetical protein
MWVRVWLVRVWYGRHGRVVFGMVRRVGHQGFGAAGWVWILGLGMDSRVGCGRQGEASRGVEGMAGSGRLGMAGHLSGEVWQAWSGRLRHVGVRQGSVRQAGSGGV